MQTTPSEIFVTMNVINSETFCASESGSIEDWFEYTSPLETAW